MKGWLRKLLGRPGEAFVKVSPPGIPDLPPPPEGLTPADREEYRTVARETRRHWQAMDALLEDARRSDRVLRFRP